MKRGSQCRQLETPACADPTEREVWTLSRIYLQIGSQKKERLDSVVRLSSDRTGFNREENCNEISVCEKLFNATSSGEDANGSHIHTNSYRLEPKTELIPFLDWCEAKNDYPASHLNRPRQGTALENWGSLRGLVEAHAYVRRSLFEMHGVDEANLPVFVRHDERLGARSSAEEPNAAQ